MSNLLHQWDWTPKLRATQTGGTSEALMHEGELVEDQWLLVYEANVKGWLSNLGGKDFVATSKYFGPMKAAGVSFYDTVVTPSITVKPVATQGYDGSNDDFDLEYLLGHVSG